MKKLDKKFRTIQNINNFFFTKKRINMKDTILIVGSPRSGTTLLMEIFSTLPKYFSSFEPLNPIWYPESYEVGFRSRTYLKSECNWPEGEEYLRKIFTGQIANLPMRDNPLPLLLQAISFKNFIHYLFSTNLIVKSINMNRMLPWIVKCFQLKGVFFIIRHPCAVIASQLKTGFCGYRSEFPPYFDIFPTKKNILDEISEMNNFDSDLLSKLRNIEKKEEILAVTWCLDNCILLAQPKTYPWKLVIYEKLIQEGEKEIKSLFDNIGEKDIPKSAFYQLKKPSVTTMSEDKKFIKKPDLQLSKWKEYLSEEQIKRILKIVSYFNIDFYSEDVEPIYEKFY